jgi:hypothetical protein
MDPATKLSHPDDFTNLASADLLRSKHAVREMPLLERRISPE